MLTVRPPGGDVVDVIWKRAKLSAGQVCCRPQSSGAGMSALAPLLRAKQT